MNNYTTNPISTVAPVTLEPEYMRLPKPGTRDPVFGLPRTVLNELILPCAKNKGRPPVRSVVLRKRGARTGIRLIDLDSLRSYLDKHVESAYREDKAKLVQMLQPAEFGKSRTDQLSIS